MPETAACSNHTRMGNTCKATMLNINNYDYVKLLWSVFYKQRNFFFLLLYGRHAGDTERLSPLELFLVMKWALIYVFYFFASHHLLKVGRKLYSHDLISKKGKKTNESELWRMEKQRKVSRTSQNLNNEKKVFFVYFNSTFIYLEMHFKDFHVKIRDSHLC